MRLFTDGAEMRDLLFWDFSGDADVRNAPIAPYQSAYYYHTGFLEVYKVLPTPIDECYWRARVFSANPSISSIIGMVRKVATPVAWVAFDAIRRFTAVCEAPIGVVGTATLVAVPNQWYEIEVYFKMDNANGRFVVYIDGIKFIDYTGDTKPAADVDFDNWRFASGSGFGWEGIDDLAFNDTTSGVDDSYPGDGVIVKVGPSDNGTHNNWHGSDGNDVDNFEMCDEFPNDGDTTYVYHDGAIAGTQQQFAMDDTYVGTNKTITRIYAEARARKTSAIGYQIKLGQLAAGGVDVVSAGRDVLEGQYIRIVGDESKLNPVTAAAWVEADIDALEFVAEVG